MFYLRKRSGRCNNLPKNLQVPGCTLMKQNTIVIMLHGWHAGTLLIFHSKKCYDRKCLYSNTKIF